MMMKKKMKIKIGAIIVLGMSLWYFNTVNNKYNNISNKLDVIISVSEKNKIDSLYQEIMDLGQKLDSMVLKYDYGWEFTN